MEAQQRYNRGEIWFAELHPMGRSIQSGKRPVIIVSNEKNNLFSPTVNVVPITSKSKNNLPVHVAVGSDCGLPFASTALAEQIMTISKDQLISKIGKCTELVLSKVIEATHIQTASASTENVLYVDKLANRFVEDNPQLFKTDNGKKNFSKKLADYIQYHCTKNEVKFAQVLQN
jgi:mRNA interferase MazF